MLNVPVCHSFFLARHFSFAVALFQQARAAYSIAIASGFDGIHRSLLDVAIDRPPVDVDEFRGVWDFEQLHILLTNRAPDSVA